MIKRWQEWCKERRKSDPIIRENTESVLDQAKQEIEAHFADFMQKLQGTIGQKKDSWLSGGLKWLGNKATGANNPSRQHPWLRNKVGSLLSGAGERMRPKTGMEQDFASEAAETIVDKLLDGQTLLVEANVPDFVEELKQKVMKTMEKAVVDMYNIVQNTPSATPMKQPTGKPAELQQLAVKYGGIGNVPPEELNRLYTPLKSGGQSAAAKKAIGGVAPLAKWVDDPRQIRRGVMNDADREGNPNRVA